MGSEPTPRLVSYALVSPGFEAVYTGEVDAAFQERTEGPMLLTVDQAGNVIRKWSTWTWTWPGQEQGWDDEILHLNRLQQHLPPLSDDVRRIRAQIGSLVPCDNGFPVTVDELLQAIGAGKLRTPSFHPGCWMAGMWWREDTTQPGQDESMQAIEAILVGYLANTPPESLIARFPYAREFTRRTYECLGPVEALSPVQRLLMERLLLPFGFLTKRNPDYAVGLRHCFEEGGRGAQLDAQIAALANLPRIYPDYQHEFRETLETLVDPGQRDLYRLCGALAHGLHGLSDCHHSTFRWIENWIYGIGTGRWGIPTRRPGAERKRLGYLLFGYALALDRWLLDVPMQFLLLDLGHIDLGFDPKNEILRVYAYLGEARSPEKQWLVACLWRTLMHNLGGLGSHHRELLDRANQAQLSVREWMDSALGKRADRQVPG